MRKVSKNIVVALEDNYLGCIIDKSTIDNEILANYFEQVVGIPRDKYINSGVLLMNAKKLRELKIDEKFLDLYTKYGFDVVAPDQDYINAMCYGHMKYLKDELEYRLSKYDIKMGNVYRRPIDGLIAYHVLNK